VKATLRNFKFLKVAFTNLPFEAYRTQ